MQPHQVDAISQEVNRVSYLTSRLERRFTNRDESRDLEQLETAAGELLSGIQMLRLGQVRFQPAYTAPTYLVQLPAFSGWIMSNTTTNHPDKFSQREMIWQGFARTQAEMDRVGKSVRDNMYPAPLDHSSIHRLRESIREYNALARQHNRSVAAFSLHPDLEPLKNIRTGGEISPFPLRVDDVSKYRSETLVGVLHELGIVVNTRDFVREYIIYIFKQIIGVEV